MAKKNVDRSSEEKFKSVDDQLKKFLGASLKTSFDQVNSDLSFITPAYDLNRILSGSFFKGLRPESFTLFVGPEATGKSSFMCLCAKEAQKKGYTPVIIDTEGAWKREFMERWGIDTENIKYFYTPWVEEISIIISTLINNDTRNVCLILDSIGGIEALKVLDAGTGDIKADQGGLTKKIKRMLKLILNLCKGYDGIALASGHYYGNPGQYGAAETVGGGNAARLLPDTIISLKKSKIEGENKKIIGTKTTAITLKNRYHSPYSECVVEINYTKGINKLAGILDLAIEAGLIERNGAWYYCSATKERAQGAIQAEELLSDELILQLDEWIKNSGYSTHNINIEIIEKEKEKIIEKEEEENK